MTDNEHEEILNDVKDAIDKQDEQLKAKEEAAKKISGEKTEVVTE